MSDHNHRDLKPQLKANVIKPRLNFNDVIALFEEEEEARKEETDDD